MSSGNEQVKIGKRWLSVGQAAELTGIYAPSTIRQLCERGKLRGAVRNGSLGKWRIPEQSVIDWIQSLHSATRVIRRKSP